MPNPKIISLRVFLTLLLLSAASCAQLPSSSKNHPGLSILQLASLEDRAEFNVLAHRSWPLEVLVKRPDGSALAPERHDQSQWEDSPWVIHHLLFTGLQHSEEELHRLVVRARGSVLDEREFGTFRVQGQGLRFAVGSCADQRSADTPIWQSISDRRPEWFFFIGDNAYVTLTPVSSARELWERHAAARQQIGLYRWQRLIPVHAVWDDNDYGLNNGGAEFALRDAAQEIYRSFFLPRFDHPQLARGPGLATRLSLRGMHFHFLDNRSFRSADPEGEHLGAEQTKWLFEDLAQSQLPSWLLMGDQFFGGHHGFESFEGSHPRAFEAFVTGLKGQSTPFVMVSGDRHLSEVMQFPRSLLGQLSFEFTTSPLHARTYPGNAEKYPNPWRVKISDDSEAFMLFETGLRESSWGIALEAIDPAGRTLFGRDLSLTTEALKDFTIEPSGQQRRRYRRARWRR